MSNYILELTDNDFDSQFILKIQPSELKKYNKSNKNVKVLVMFYAPWCGYCTRSMDDYNELAKYYKDNSEIIIAKLNCEIYEDMINDFNRFANTPKINGFPTILLFHNNLYYKKFNMDRSLDNYKLFLESGSSYKSFLD